MTVVDDPPSGSNSPDSADTELGTMTLFEHLAELRNRVIICIIALVVTTIVAWFLYDRAIDFMREPYCNFIRHHHSKSVSGCDLVTNGPLEGVTTRLKICAYGGIALSAPVLFWELWRFVTPGLHKNEKRYIVPFVGAGVVLFAMGVTVSILIFPRALTWLIDVGGTGVVPLFSPSKYFTLYVLMCLIFGAVFMYPLLLVFLEIAGVVPSTTWRRWRRPAIVIIALVAAVITPSSDPFSFLAMAIPMLVFYEASIILGRLMHK
jgi:sec-independent protein translocase protein TatC